jgi:phosphatidylglycerophosphate synthase
LTAESVLDGPLRPGGTLLVALTTVALLLDWVDGRVARRTATTSELGARFDMEVDALLILVLSVHVTASFGVWVLLIGAARYLRLLACVPWRWLRSSSPVRYWAKVVAAYQCVALAAAASGLLPPPVTGGLLLAGLLLLGESFGREIWWLRTHRPGAVVPSDAADPAAAEGVLA